MISKTITYNVPSLTKHGEEEEVTETFYFSLTSAEAKEINLVEDLEAVYAARDPRRILKTMKRIVAASFAIRYGAKLAKDDEATAIFMASEAYSQLIDEILFNEDAEEKMAEFIRGMLPADWEQKNKDQPALPSA